MRFPVRSTGHEPDAAVAPLCGAAFVTGRGAGRAKKSDCRACPRGRIAARKGAGRGVNPASPLGTPWLQSNLKYLNMAVSSGETIVRMSDLMPQFSTWWWIGT